MELIIGAIRRRASERIRQQRTIVGSPTGAPPKDQDTKPPPHRLERCGEVLVIAGVEDKVDPTAFAVGFGTYNVNTARLGRAMKAPDIPKEVWNTYNASIANLYTVAYWRVTNNDVKAAM
ncbi:hypothetical protein DL768_001381 [Monosporascus sp. mg162]|nr:hypothetical protein DL768_001381 [Monosporascus sp. mg162]